MITQQVKRLDPGTFQTLPPGKTPKKIERFRKNSYVPSRVEKIKINFDLGKEEKVGPTLHKKSKYGVFLVEYVKIGTR